MRTLYATLALALLAAALLPQRSAAQELDSLQITFTQYTRVVQVGIWTNCHSQFVGSHPDPIGNGEDSDYTYFFDTSSTIGDGYMNDTPSEWTGVSEDIPGEVITFTGGYRSSSGPGDNVDCTPTFEGHAAAWAGFTAWVHFTPPPNQPPTARFTWSQSEAELFTIDVDGSGSDDEDGQIVSYAWDFGDGESGSGITPSHTYKERGEYEVTLTVTDDDDDTDETTRTVNVEGPDLRYAVSLERIGATVGKTQQDENPVFQVGDTVRVHVEVENTGDVPLQNVRVPDDFAGVEVYPADALEALGADAATGLNQTVLDELAPGASGELIFAHEAVHTVPDRGGVSVGTVEAEAEAAAASTAERVVEEGITCTTGDKRGGVDAGVQDASQGCASFSVFTQPLVASLELEPDPTASDEPLLVGDTLAVRATVRNIGAEPLFSVGSPAPVEASGVRFTPLSTFEPSQVNELAPGATATFTMRLRPEETGTATLELPDITAFDGAGEQVYAEADGQGLCTGVRCRAEFPVETEQVEIALRTTTGEGESLSVKSGLFYEPGFEIRPMEQIEAGGSLAQINFVCRSSCVDVEIVVVEPSDASPVEGTSVTLGAPALTGAAIVTPAGATGEFCSRPKQFGERPTCGNPLSLETDEDGKVNAYYTLPGVVEEVTNTITAVVDVGEEQETKQAQVTVEPNVAHEASASLVRDEAILLSGVSTTSLAALGVSIVGETCKAMLNAVTGPAATLGGRISNPTLNSTAGTAVEFLCTLVPTQPIEGPAGIIKRVSEIGQLSWFFDRFGVSIPGIVNVVPRPPPQFANFENDFMSAVNEAFLRASGFGQVGAQPAAIRGATIEIKLYEVSYLDQTALADGLTEALYFTMTITPPGRAPFKYKKLMTEGTYVPQTWLLPPQDQFLSDVIEQAQAGDTQVTTGGAGGKQTASSQDAQTFQVGDYVAVGMSSADGEANQIIAVEGATLHLAAPLRHDHAAGTFVVRLAEGEVGPPSPPLLVPPTGDDGLAPLWPQFTWQPRPLSFAMTYDLQLASDSLFTTLVAEAEGVSEAPYEVGALGPDVTYYWRMRAANLIAGGEAGPWSAPQPFTTGVVGVDVEGDPEVPAQVALEANYPNPFNPQTTIGYVLPEASAVRLVIYDVLGREVTVLVDGTRPAGRQEVTFEAANLPSGVYLYQLQAGAPGSGPGQSFTQTRRMLLVK